LQNALQGYQVYQRGKYETASPHRLISMLYEGAIRFAARGAEAIGRQDHAEAHQSLVRAQAIVAELIGCLNEEQGGDLARRLRLLYLYMHDRLVEANLRKQREPADEVVRLLADIKQAWDEIGKGSPLERATS